MDFLNMSRVVWKRSSRWDLRTCRSFRHRRLFILCLGFFVSGCQFDYLIKSGYHQAELLRARRSFDDVLQDPNVGERVKKKIQLAQKVRQFAEEELHLKPTDNYTSYVQLKGDYITYAVGAAPKFEFKHYLWKYPLVGELPYKGFFEKSEADEEARELASQGYDTYVRGVSAYSTLGWFKDPLLSSMIRGDDDALVDLIIHETTHATVYIKSAADFNERLATFIASVGTEKYYLKLEGEDSPTLKKIRMENEDQKLFAAFLSDEIRKLKKWYEDHTAQSSPITPRGADAVIVRPPAGIAPGTEDSHNMEELRQAQFQEIQKRYKTEVVPKLKTESFKTFADVSLNNARLLSYQTYFMDLSDFEKKFQQMNRNFQEFLSFCRSLESAKNPEMLLKAP